MRKVDEDVIIADWEEILLSELTGNPPTKLKHGNTCQHKEKEESAQKEQHDIQLSATMSSFD